MKTAKMQPLTKRWLLGVVMLKCCRWESDRFYTKIAEICAGINATSAMHRDICYIYEQVQKGRDIVNMLHDYQKGKKVCNM